MYPMYFLYSLLPQVIFATLNDTTEPESIKYMDEQRTEVTKPDVADEVSSLSLDGNAKENKRGSNVDNKMSADNKSGIVTESKNENVSKIDQGTQGDVSESVTSPQNDESSGKTFLGWVPGSTTDTSSASDTSNEKPSSNANNDGEAKANTNRVSVTENITKRISSNDSIFKEKMKPGKKSRKGDSMPKNKKLQEMRSKDCVSDGIVGTDGGNPSREDSKGEQSNEKVGRKQKIVNQINKLFKK